MKKPKKPNNPWVFSRWVFSKKPIGSNQIGPNQAHPENTRDGVQRITRGLTKMASGYRLPTWQCRGCSHQPSRRSEEL